MRNFLNLKSLVLVLLALSVFVLLTAEDCNESNKNEETLDLRWERNGQAIDKYGIPETVNFPFYGVLYDMTMREDMINHPWYLYVTTELGTYTGYYVATTPPVNACNFVSTTQDIHFDDNGGNVIVDAPSLDGIFYGGAGASGACDAWVFFDYNTGAMVWTREKMRASDAPFVLATDVPRLIVDTTPPNIGPQAPETIPSKDKMPASPTRNE